MDNMIGKYIDIYWVSIEVEVNKKKLSKTRGVSKMLVQSCSMDTRSSAVVYCGNIVAPKCFCLVEKQELPNYRLAGIPIDWPNYVIRRLTCMCAGCWRGWHLERRPDVREAAFGPRGRGVRHPHPEHPVPRQHAKGNIHVIDVWFDATNRSNISSRLQIQ